LNIKVAREFTYSVGITEVVDNSISEWPNTVNYGANQHRPLHQLGEPCQIMDHFETELEQVRPLAIAIKGNAPV
jgi:hypothetical protein